MLTRFSLIAIALILVALPGCRNRMGCYNGQCGSGFRPAIGERFNPLAGLGSPTITPPATGSYRVSPGNSYMGPTPTLPASGSSTVPVQPASSLSPGWRQVNPSGNSATHNPTSYSLPNRYAEIPMNNVVSSTQTSSMDRKTTLAENVNIGVSTNNRVASQPVGLGMPVNDATNVTTPRTRNVAGTYEYVVRPNRSGQTYPHNVPYSAPFNNGVPYNGGIIANSQTNYGSSNGGWQERGNNGFNR